MLLRPPVEGFLCLYDCQWESFFLFLWPPVGVCCALMTTSGRVLVLLGPTVGGFCGFMATKSILAELRPKPVLAGKSRFWRENRGFGGKTCFGPLGVSFDSFHSKMKKKMKKKSFSFDFCHF